MIDDKTALVLCPICRAENRPETAYCFLCGQALAGAEVAAARKPCGIVAPVAPHWARFRLNSLMLLIALIAVSLGIWNEAPQFIVLFVVPAVIALVRTVMVSDGRDSGFKRIGIFMVTFAALVGVAVAGFVAFCATCLAIMSTGEGEFGVSRQGPGLIVGGIAGVAVMVWVTVLLFRRASRKRRGSA